MKLAGEGKLKSWERGGPESYKSAGLEATSLESCLRCHDDYNSPDFDGPGYWEKVKH